MNNTLPTSENYHAAFAALIPLKLTIHAKAMLEWERSLQIMKQYLSAPLITEPEAIKSHITQAEKPFMLNMDLIKNY